MIKKKEIFKGVATVLLLFPGGLILVVAVSVLVAVAIALLIYGGVIYQTSKWCWNKLGSVLNFGKVEPIKQPDGSRSRLEVSTETVPQGARLPKDIHSRTAEKQVFDGRAAARGRWLQ